MTPNKELSSLENTDGHELTRGQRGGFMENCYCLSSRSVFCPPPSPRNVSRNPGGEVV